MCTICKKCIEQSINCAKNVHLSIKFVSSLHDYFLSFFYLLILLLSLFNSYNKCKVWEPKKNYFAYVLRYVSYSSLDLHEDGAQNT